MIVGWASGAASVVACLFDASGAGNNKGLGTLGGYESTAMHINNSNLIVGWAENSNRIQHACIFDITGNGNNIDLGTLGGNSSIARSANDIGFIVGNAANAIGNQIACLFDATGAGHNVGLGTLGGNSSYAFDINNRNQIVGWASTASGDRHACLFDSTGNGTNIDLNSLIDPGLGWTLTDAYSINDNGWIIGQGINPFGEIHAFLLIPEPMTIVMFAIGCLSIRKRRLG